MMLELSRGRTGRKSCSSFVTFPGLHQQLAFWVKIYKEPWQEVRRQKKERCFLLMPPSAGVVASNSRRRARVSKPFLSPAV